MRFVNHQGRFTLLDADGRGVDVHRASAGALPWAPHEALERWTDVLEWARDHRDAGDIEIDDRLVGPPSPRPRQALGVGLNYASHAQEAGVEVPEQPMIFPKLAAAIAGPYDDIPIASATVDWEVELTVIVGRLARHVAAADAWGYVAGLTIGQDLSDREVQLRPRNHPQYSLGKSLPSFGPIGPALVTLDELGDPAELELVCSVNGEEVQRGRVDDLIFSIPELIEYLSGVTVLYPGDVLMTGTPPGIGATRTPPRFLSAGDVLESRIDGLGVMRHRIVAAA
jgi:2-keto-4-pentenoate hydratase/2-oxohepta-3-ene-1,7-dioic acid hydratase in catechol pathway